MFAGYFIQIESTTCGLLCLAFANWHNAFEVHPWCNTSCYLVLFDCWIIFQVAVIVQLLNRVRLFATPGLQHARPPCPSPTPGVYSNSCPLSQWCYLNNILSALFAFCLQSFPASGSFLMSQFFASDGQSIGVSASKSVLPMNSQNWFPLGWTAWISLQSKWLSRVFPSTTVWKHQFFGPQTTLWPKSHTHTQLLEKP